MFPQLGAPIGFLLSGGIFLLLSEFLSNDQFLSFGWRIPFLASAILVIVGLYVRLKLTETPAFQKTLESNQRVKVPILSVFRHHFGILILGTLLATSTFVVFYLMTVFSQSWATTALKIPRTDFLLMQLFSVLFFGLTIPLSAKLADKYGGRLLLIVVSTAIALFGFLLAPMFGSGNMGLVTVFLSLGMSLMGMTYGPLGTVLSELFPTELRYTGTSLTFNFAGILGASLAPYIAMWLARNYDLGFVGYYLSAAALLSLIALLLVGKERNGQLALANS